MQFGRVCAAARQEAGGPLCRLSLRLRRRAEPSASEPAMPSNLPGSTTRNVPGSVPGNVQGKGTYNVYGNDTYVVYSYYHEMLLLECLGLFGVVVGACAAAGLSIVRAAYRAMEALRPRRTREE